MSEPVSSRRYRFGRLQIGWTAWCHKYPTTSDRWVIQPLLIWDAR